MTGVQEDAVTSMEGYVRYGARYWPSAAYFTLIGLDENGEGTGAGADVCAGCVDKVAIDAIAVMTGDVKVPFTGSAQATAKPGYLGDGALAQCGQDHAYEIWGESDSHTAGYDSPTTCAECGEEIE